MSAYATVYRVQCQTAKIWREMLGMPDGAIAAPMGHPICLLRLLPPYRTPASLAVRKAVADRMRKIRQHDHPPQRAERPAVAFSCITPALPLPSACRAPCTRSCSPST